MLTVFLRAIVIYIFLLITMRLMGKKQLGELQPFEFAISLIVADLACIPMGDTSVPLAYGLIPIFTLFVLHLLVTKIVKHSIGLRRLINGKPVIVITPDGIDINKLHQLDMTTNDLLEALRGSGYFSPDEVMYGIVETNGTLSVLPRTETAPVTLSDISDNSKLEPAVLPVTLISEGKVLKDNLTSAGIDKSVLAKILDYYHYNRRDILLLTLRDDEIYLQPKSGNAISESREEIGV